MVGDYCEYGGCDEAEIEGFGEIWHNKLSTITNDLEARLRPAVHEWIRSKIGPNNP